MILPFVSHGKVSSYTGVGTGLAIWKKIVERHCGTVTAGSTPGKGSTFIVGLPRTARVEAHEEREKSGRINNTWLKDSRCMSQYVAAIDQGTTSTRCILFDYGGNVLSVAQKEHRQIYPRPGWVEHDPLEIWANTQEVVRSALGNISTGKPIAIGVTNQRETTVVWEKSTGRPICNAIVWQDTRTAGLCRELARSGGQDRLRAKTGLPLATYFSGPKIKWILDNVPGVEKTLNWLDDPEE